MSWVEISFVQPSANIDTSESLLERHGVLSISLEDAKDQPLFEPKPDEIPLWDSLLVKALFNSTIDSQHVTSDLEKLPGIDDIRKCIIEDQDWVRSWMDRYEPIHIGNDLWICPSWLTPPNSDAVNIILDPGLAFGSGTHPTTALCLEWLSKNKPAGLDVLDFGCGSGILSIASLKTGASSVTGVDIDPLALVATRNNAKQNSVHMGSLTLTLTNEKKRPGSEYDLVLANILSGTLIELSDYLIQSIKPGGEIVLSGILVEQINQVTAAYEASISFEPEITQGDWVLLHGIKRYT